MSVVWRRLPMSLTQVKGQTETFSPFHFPMINSLNTPVFMFLNVSLISDLAEIIISSPTMHCCSTKARTAGEQAGKIRSHTLARTHSEPCGHQTITNSVSSASIKRWNEASANQSSASFHDFTSVHTLKILLWSCHSQRIWSNNK